MENKKRTFRLGDRVRVVSNGDRSKYAWIYDGSVGTIDETDGCLFTLKFEKKCFNPHMEPGFKSESDLFGKAWFADESLVPEEVYEQTVEDFSKLLFG